jgi:hypothetical protein
LDLWPVRSTKDFGIGNGFGEYQDCVVGDEQGGSTRVVQELP